jgi:hypothetical protein
MRGGAGSLNAQQSKVFVKGLRAKAKNGNQFRLSLQKAPVAPDAVPRFATLASRSIAGALHYLLYAFGYARD